jgi:gas vesicle protein
MSIRYRVLCLLMVLGLAGSPWETRAQNAPMAVSQEETLKGQIWTVTAKQVWADAKLGSSPPPPWATSKEFEEWLLKNPAPAAKSELGILRGAVISRIGKGQVGTSGQVAQAILDEISQRQQESKGKLARVNVATLLTNLSSFIQPGAPITTTAGPTDSSSAASSDSSANPAVVSTAPSNLAEDPNPVPESPSSAEKPVVNAPLTKPALFGLSPYVALIIGAVLGALAGAVLMRQKMKKESRLRQQQRRMTSTASATETENSDMNSPKFNKLKREHQDLQRQFDQLKKELADLKARVTGVPAAPLKAAPPKRTTSAPPPPPVQAPTDDHDELLNVGLGTIAPPEPAYEQPAAQLPLATRYGPVQETPFVEERKIVDNPLPQLALMLTVNPRNPDQASFTLNPHVNQSMLIGDGLNRLQKFFEYDPPVGRINSVAAAAAGTLQRQADGWQVVERARLIIR